MDAFQTDERFALNPISTLVAAVERLGNSQRTTNQATRLIAHGFLPDGDAFYTAPLQTTVEIRELHLCNSDASDRTFTMWLLPPGEVMADEHLIYNEVTIPSKGYVTLSMIRVIEADWQIFTEVSSVDSITGHISGTELAVR